jgi:hypothetical protein
MNQRDLNPQFHRILDFEPLTAVSSENGRELLLRCRSDDATTIVLQMSEKLALDLRTAIADAIRQNGLLKNAVGSPPANDDQS